MQHPHNSNAPAEEPRLSTLLYNPSASEGEDKNNNPENEETKEILFNGVEISKLTKSQTKKYHKMLKYQEGKQEKRKRERLRTKVKRKEARANNIDLGPSRKQLKCSTMANSLCKTSVVIDLNFDDLMSDKDLGKVVKQILRVYTDNRRSATPMQLYLTSLNGRVKQEMSKHSGYEHWDINFCAENYIKLFSKDRLVYLTSESDNVVNHLDQDKIYVIGGLVDHNAHKGLCHKLAVEQGISHGQLPIESYFTFDTRKVFTINQVFEVLLRVSEGRSFKEAFQIVLPKRIRMVPTSPSNEIDSTQ